MPPQSRPHAPPRHARRPVVAALILAAAAAAAALWLYRAGTGRGEADAVRRALDQGRLDEAARALGRWEEIEPRSGELHFLRARLGWARKDLPAAYEALTTARSLGYPAPDMAGLRGLLLARTNQVVEAEPLLQEAADQAGRIDPDVAEALAQIYLGAYRLARASALLERWMKDWPDDARPYFLHAEIDARNRAGDEVILDHLRGALRRDPELHEARLRLADLLRAIHRNAEAAEEYAAYQRSKPEDPRGYLGAGRNALDMADLPSAIRQLDRALELTPDDPVILGARAAAAIRQGRIAAARDYLDRAVKADPFDYGNRYQRMLLLGQLGNRAEADAERLAVEQIRKDQEEFTSLTRQLERNPLDTQLRSKAASWLMAHGHEAEAVDWARLVLRTNPSDPAMNRLLADHYRKVGNVGLANFHEAHAAPPGRGEAPPGP